MPAIPKDTSYTEVVSFKVTKHQKEILDENNGVKEEMVSLARRYLNVFIPEENKRKD